MPEQLTTAVLQQRIDTIQLGLHELDSNPDICAVAFYAKPPWQTQGEQDLDLLVVTSDGVSEDTNTALNSRLSSLAKANIKIDAWVLTASQLTQRMKRIAGLNPKVPPILRSISEWNGFGFVPVVGEEYLTKTINACYASPEQGGAIPPNPAEHRVFE